MSKKIHSNNISTPAINKVLEILPEESQNRVREELKIYTDTLAKALKAIKILSGDKNGK